MTIDAPTSDTRVARDAAAGISARVIAMACSSITALLIASALTRSQYGAYAIIVGINVLLVMALDLGLTSSLARYVAQGRATTRLVIGVAITRLAIISLAAFVILASPIVNAVDASQLAPLLPMLAALIVAQSLIAFHFGTLPSLRRIRLLILVTIAQPIGELALVLVVRANGGDAASMLLATAASALVVALVGWVLLLVPGRAAASELVDAEDSQHATLRMVAHYGRRIFLVSLLIAVFGQIDQFVIGIFHSLADVAPYALAIKVQALIAAPAITIAGIVAPRIAGAGVLALAMYRQWLVFLVSINLGAVLVVAVLAPQLFGAIGAQYRDEWQILVALAPFLLLSAVAPLPSITLNQTGLAGDRLRIAAITVAINLVLDFALVPSIGAYGAAIATTIAFSYYFVRHHRLLQRSLLSQVAWPPSPIQALLVRASIISIAVALLAALVRFGLEAVLDDPGDILVLLVAGGAAAVVQVAWSMRIVRAAPR